MRTLFFIVLSLFFSSAQAARHALLIGNSVYDPGKPLSDGLNLPNPRNDVNKLAAKLGGQGGLGFQVQVHHDLTLTEMNRAVTNFIKGLAPGDVAWFYYAGHAVEVDGKNWLIPARTQELRRGEVTDKTISAQSVLADMEFATLGEERTAKGLNVLLLDACRRNPYRDRGFVTRDGEDRLAQMKPTVYGTLISFATAADRLAEDGEGGNSPYMESLLNALDRYADSSIEYMFKQVVADVLTRTQHKQQPWLDHRFTTDEQGGDFCLHPKGCAKTAWQQVQATKNAAAYRGFIADYPHSDYTDTARTMLALLEDNAGYVPLPPRDNIPPRDVISTVTQGETFTDSATGMEFVKIPGGCFQMGSPETEKDRSSDEKQHRVCVDEFWMGKTEVTQAQWEQVMGSNPSNFKGANKPVEQVSWNDAQEFLGKLSARDGKTYRLPTEAEWEYAARAGTATPFSTGECIGTDQANYNGNYPYQSCPKGEYRQQTVDAASFPANAFGLHDMHGNVWEWTCSGYDENYGGDESSCNNDANAYVLRGGSWNLNAHVLRAAYRDRYTPDLRSNNLGFRVVFQ